MAYGSWSFLSFSLSVSLSISLSLTLSLSVSLSISLCLSLSLSLSSYLSLCTCLSPSHPLTSTDCSSAKAKVTITNLITPDSCTYIARLRALSPQTVTMHRQLTGKGNSALSYQEPKEKLQLPCRHAVYYQVSGEWLYLGKPITNSCNKQTHIHV